MGMMLSCACLALEPQPPIAKNNLYGGVRFIALVSRSNLLEACYWGNYWVGLKEQIVGGKTLIQRCPVYCVGDHAGWREK